MFVKTLLHRMVKSKSIGVYKACGDESQGSPLIVEFQSRKKVALRSRFAVEQDRLTPPRKSGNPKVSIEKPSIKSE